jgi:hypothetical protein
VSDEELAKAYLSHAFDKPVETQVNLLTTANEVLAERLAAAETEHARDLAAYQLTVENLTAEIATHCACIYDGDKRVSQCEVHEAWYDTLHEQGGYRRERDALTERVKALEAMPLTPPDGWAEAVSSSQIVLDNYFGKSLVSVELAQAALDMDARHGRFVT